MSGFAQGQAFVVDNRSTVVTDGDARTMVAACNLLMPAMAAAWGLPAPRIVFARDAAGAAADPDAWQFHIVDNDPTAPGNLAYHGEDDDRPDGSILAQTILANRGAVLWGGANVSTVASALFHEIAEALCDRFCNTWWQNPATGEFFAAEVCDPVQGLIVPVVVTVAGGVQPPAAAPAIPVAPAPVIPAPPTPVVPAPLAPSAPAPAVPAPPATPAAPASAPFNPFGPWWRDRAAETATPAPHRPLLVNQLLSSGSCCSNRRAAILTPITAEAVSGPMGPVAVAGAAPRQDDPRRDALANGAAARAEARLAAATAAATAAASPTTAVTVGLSNFIYPAWCDPEAEGGAQYDYLRALSAPFQIAKNGYAIVSSGGRPPVNRFGDLTPDWIKQWKTGSARMLTRQWKK